MKKVQVGEFKTKFSSILKEVEKGEVFEVTYGKNNEVKGYFVPPDKYEKKKVILGLGKMRGASIILKDDFEFTNGEIEEMFGI